MSVTHRHAERLVLGGKLFPRSPAVLRDAAVGSVFVLVTVKIVCRARAVAGVSDIAVPAARQNRKLIRAPFYIAVRFASQYNLGVSETQRKTVILYRLHFLSLSHVSLSRSYAHIVLVALRRIPKHTRGYSLWEPNTVVKYACHAESDI